jgi:hypothetical protein
VGADGARPYLGRVSEDRWAAWRFLLGEWVGVGGGTPGEAESGGTRFSLELAEQVLVRRNWARYGDTKDRTAFSHEDLIYVHPHGDAWLAVYFDSEGHVINYRATAAESHAIFESDADERGVRYRLRYLARGSGLELSFEIAPKGGAFAEYVSARLDRP